MGEPWRSYADNVLLAAGNYAGRICHDEQGILLWSFFTPGGLNRLTNNFMPPPKRLVRNENGHLHVKTFEGFEGQVMSCAKIHRFTSLIDDDCVSSVPISDSFELKCEAGFQMFALEEPFDCFRMRVILKLVEEGKVGIIFRLDRQTHDGYFISLDLFKGVAQLRAWGSGLDGSGEDMMQF